MTLATQLFGVPPYCCHQFSLHPAQWECHALPIALASSFAPSTSKSCE
jgi:hypothetical protein